MAACGMFDSCCIWHYFSTHKFHPNDNRKKKKFWKKNNSFKTKNRHPFLFTCKILTLDCDCQRQCLCVFFCAQKRNGKLMNAFFLSFFSSPCFFLFILFFCVTFSMVRAWWLKKWNRANEMKKKIPQCDTMNTIRMLGEKHIWYCAHIHTLLNLCHVHIHICMSTSISAHQSLKHTRAHCGAVVLWLFGWRRTHTHTSMDDRERNFNAREQTMSKSAHKQAHISTVSCSW